MGGRARGLADLAVILACAVAAVILFLGAFGL